MADDVNSYLDAVDASYEDSGSSPSGNGVNLNSILGGVTQLAGAAGTLYGQVNGRPVNKPAAPASSSSALTKYLPWAIGAVVLVIVLSLFTGGRR